MQRLILLSAIVAISATTFLASEVIARELSVPSELGAAKSREPRSGTTLDYPRSVFSSRDGL
jgi:hypothetical protein